ncbi:MAG: creatininase family protein [Thermodesulfobacteriota bacterium]
MTSHSHEARPLLWQELTWPEIAALRDAGMDMVILPVGSTEQHGPHLAVDTDTVTATSVAHAVSERTGVPVLPAVPFGCSLGHSHRWPGTLSLEPQTLAQLVFECLSWAYRSGFRRILILNGHVTNAAPLRCALELLRARFDDGMVALRDVGAVSERVRRAFASDAEDWHANRAETALILAVRPERVRASLLVSSDDPDRTAGLLFAHPVNRTSANGVTGSPSGATPELGREVFAMIVDDLTEQVRAGLRERPPLEASYFGEGARR